jgi:hypothetical protein
MDGKQGIIDVGGSPSSLIERAIDKGADLDKLEKLLALKERFDANEARKSYHKAMADFKDNPPEIGKDKKVSFSTSAGKTSYNHASLANVTKKIGAELSKHGLSASWTTKQNGLILVTCRITHVQGHSEETTLSAAADTSGSKNSIQAIGSTITYLERYTLLALTGLATEDMDDDGKGAAVEFITKEQINIILDGVASLELKTEDNKKFMDKFFKFMKVEKLEEIHKTDYQKAMNVFAVEKKRKEGKK